MNASISPIKQITCTTKTSNDTFPTTSSIETTDLGHYRFLKCRLHFFYIWKNYNIRVFSRHIIDEKLNFVLEFFHGKNCMQKFLQFYAKNLQKFLLIRPNAVNFSRFSQLLVEVKNAKNEICIISDNSSNMAAIRLKICTKQS